jgi:hypothetical protein
VEHWLNLKFQAIRESHFRTKPILVIHQGILDVIGQDWMEGLKGDISEVVVTSGRGIPDNLPARVRFIPLSTVLLYTIGAKSKFHLVQALLAARRPAKEDPSN